MESREPREAGAITGRATRAGRPIPVRWISGSVRAAIRPAWVVIVLWLAGCGSDAPEPEIAPVGAGTPAEIHPTVDPPQTWTLTEAPALSIGVVEGDEVYQLDRVLSVVRMSDGRLAALNAGSSEVRFFSPEGEHLTSVGGPGSGPGEYQAPRRLWRTSADSLVVFDARAGRFSVLDGQGGLLGTRTFERPSDVAFPLDDWIHGRNWIESAVHPDDRGPVLDVLERMPPPHAGASVRFVLLTDSGHLWTTNAMPPVDSDALWTVYDLAGEPMAGITIPARFEVHEVGPDYVLGVARDEVGVESIELYGLTGPEESMDGRRADLGNSVALSQEARGSVSGRSGAAPTQPGPPEVLGALRMMSTAQEAEYGRSHAYTTDLAALGGSVPDGVDFTLIQGDAGGWAVIADIGGAGLQCYLGVGQANRRSTPLGYPSGSPICW